MPRVVHIVGNGDHASLFQQEERKGLILACNLAPFPIEKCYASCIVDFKMMKAITDGVLDVPGDWVLGARPKVWMEKNPNFYMQRSPQVKEFYLKLPKYAENYTDFNCGHMATHYACNKFKPDIVNMYGFDSIFDFNLRSCSDFYLSSDRATQHNHKLSSRWRPIWQNMFKEFKNTKFILHHSHSEFKFPVSENVEAKVYKKN